VTKYCDEPLPPEIYRQKEIAMTSADEKSKVLRFPKTGSKSVSSHERIWGKAVFRQGYAGIPSVLIQAQSRLGITPLQMNIIIQLLDYGRDPDRRPFPSKKISRGVSKSRTRPSRTTSGLWKRLA
jgi:hypothetical protein